MPAGSPASQQVERVTALRGADGEIPRPSRASQRRRTLECLRSGNPEVPYGKYEAASRDLVCSLLERQDRITEELLRRIIDLEYETGNLREEIIRRRK
jgi:hypothetical protein